MHLTDGHWGNKGLPSWFESSSTLPLLSLWCGFWPTRSCQLLIILLMLHLNGFVYLIGLFRNHAGASHIFEHLSQAMEYERKLIKGNRTYHKLSQTNIQGKKQLTFSISVAQRVNGWLQKWYLAFFINSIKVMSSPHGWGRWVMRRSNRTLVICSLTPSSCVSLNR